MIERLETTLKKYNELEQELTRPEVLSDVKKTREYSKEMASLADIVNCYKKYKKTLEDIESTKEMVKDPDLGDMAKEELKALEAEKVKGVKAYIIVWYYNHDICKAFRTSYIYSLIQAGKKSVSSEDTNGILIPGVKRKKYYDWDWSVLFK